MYTALSIAQHCALLATINAAAIETYELRPVEVIDNMVVIWGSYRRDLHGIHLLSIDTCHPGFIISMKNGPYGVDVEWTKDSEWSLYGDPAGSPIQYPCLTDARDVALAMADYQRGADKEAEWEAESERLAEAAADRYWEEGTAAEAMYRAAEQDYEDRMCGLL